MENNDYADNFDKNGIEATVKDEEAALVPFPEMTKNSQILLSCSWS